MTRPRLAAFGVSPVPRAGPDQHAGESAGSAGESRHGADTSVLSSGKRLPTFPAAEPNILSKQKVN
jgi:hypothetical protein